MILRVGIFCSPPRLRYSELMSLVCPRKHVYCVAVILFDLFLTHPIQYPTTAVILVNFPTKNAFDPRANCNYVYVTYDNTQRYQMETSGIMLMFYNCLLVCCTCFYDLCNFFRSIVPTPHPDRNRFRYFIFQQCTYLNIHAIKCIQVRSYLL
jgi:hypothetical protein